MRRFTLTVVIIAFTWSWTPPSVFQFLCAIRLRVHQCNVHYTLSSRLYKSPRNISGTIYVGTYGCTHLIYYNHLSVPRPCIVCFDLVLYSFRNLYRLFFAPPLQRARKTNRLRFCVVKNCWFFFLFLF